MGDTQPEMTKLECDVYPSQVVHDVFLYQRTSLKTEAAESSHKKITVIF